LFFVIFTLFKIISTGGANPAVCRFQPAGRMFDTHARQFFIGGSFRQLRWCSCSNGITEVRYKKEMILSQNTCKK